jgi:hypothetical protein
MVFVIQRSKEKTPMTVVPFNPPVCLPTGELDEKRAIERVRALWERTKVGTGDQERLQTELQEGLQEGDHQLAIWAVRMADESEICDTALRNVAIKLNALLLQRRDLPPLAPAVCIRPATEPNAGSTPKGAAPAAHSPAQIAPRRAAASSRPW